MNKQELTNEIIKRNPTLTKKSVNETLLLALDIIGDSLTKNETVQLLGFGTFYSTERPARIGRNPKTGDKISISKTLAPKFRAGKLLKDKLNK